jgi:hypothetical protein
MCLAYVQDYDAFYQAVEEEKLKEFLGVADATA